MLAAVCGDAFLSVGTGAFIKGDMRRTCQLHDSDKNVHDYGNPYLSFHCVLRGAVKSFYAKMLFDPFEEYLYLPPCLVERANC